MKKKYVESSVWCVALSSAGPAGPGEASSRASLGPSSLQTQRPLVELPSRAVAQRDWQGELHHQETGGRSRNCNGPHSTAVVTLLTAHDAVGPVTACH